MTMTQHDFDNEERLISLINFRAIDTLNKCIIAIHVAHTTGRNAEQAMRLGSISDRLSVALSDIRGLLV